MKARAMLGALALATVLMAPSVTEAGDRYSRQDGRRYSDRGYYRGNSYRGNYYRGDSYRGNCYRGDSYRGYRGRGNGYYYPAPRYRHYRPYRYGYGHAYAPPVYGYDPYYDPYYYAPGSYVGRPGFSFFLSF